MGSFLFQLKHGRVRWSGVAAVAGLALVLLGWGGSGAPSSSADLLKGSRFLEHIRYLASDDLVGRGNGSDGLEKAGDYIASLFREAGLRPAGEEGSYFQPFTVTLGGDIGPRTALTVEGVGLEEALRLHRDYEPMTFASAGTVAAPVVFVGYGITAPEHEYDDYEGIDVEGKIVLLLRHVPGERRQDGPFDSNRGHATFVAKAVNAKAHGAAAFLLINDPLNHQGEPDRLLRYGDDLGGDAVELPAIHIKRHIAEKLFEKMDKDLRQVQKDIDQELKPMSFELTGSFVRMNLEVSRTLVEVRNVLGYLPPAEPTSDDELLIIGGHYDHVGFGERQSKAAGKDEGQIHNGADDNASGTAGVIELARVFATRNDLKRGILFLAFAAEELGLLGSSYYTQNPTMPLEKTVAMLNLDMIGRLREDKLYIGGMASSPMFRTKLEEIGESEGLSLIYNFSGYGSSDHTSFNRIEIPALFFFTGLHGDYHRPSDDWQEINTVGGERVLRIAYRMADYLQALAERPSFSRSAKAEQRPGEFVNHRCYRTGGFCSNPC